MATWDGKIFYRGLEPVYAHIDQDIPTMAPCIYVVEFPGREISPVAAKFMGILNRIAGKPEDTSDGSPHTIILYPEDEFVLLKEAKESEEILRRNGILKLI